MSSFEDLKRTPVPSSGNQVASLETAVVATPSCTRTRWENMDVLWSWSSAVRSRTGNQETNTHTHTAQIQAGTHLQGQFP